MLKLHKERLGGILADEMGLGKTVQIAAFLSVLCDSGRGGATVIVCPATLMEQWCAELNKWAPQIPVVMLNRDFSEFEGKYGETMKKVFSFRAKRNCVLVTSYQLMLNNKHLFLDKKWQNIILDEGHMIRNPGTKVSFCVKAFRTKRRFILSGAPVQNSLKEVWSLFDFILPGKLGTLDEFERNYVTPIRRGGFSNASLEEIDLSYELALQLKDQIAPFILRRSKKDVKRDFGLKKSSNRHCFVT